MKGRRLVTFLITLLVLALSLVFAAAVLAGGGGVPLVTTMSGAEEAPGPGDPDGSGFASIWLNHGQGTICWEWSVENIAPATAAHIHKAPAGVAGPVVVPLPPTDADSSSGCAENVSQALIKDIIQNPEAYYVNVHNAEFPAGAVRGQLSNRGQSK
jgi:hypothetical protein